MLEISVAWERKYKRMVRTLAFSCGSVLEAQHPPTQEYSFLPGRRATRAEVAGAPQKNFELVGFDAPFPARKDTLLCNKIGGFFSRVRAAMNG